MKDLTQKSRREYFLQRRIQNKLDTYAPFFLGLILGASVTLLILNQVIIKLT